MSVYNKAVFLAKVLIETDESLLDTSIDIINPIFNFGLILYSNFRLDKYFRINDLIESNAKIYDSDLKHSKKFINVMMDKQSVDDFTENDKKDILSFINNIKNKELLKNNINKEKEYLNKNKSNLLLKTYFFINNQTIENELSKCNYILSLIG